MTGREEREKESSRYKQVQQVIETENYSLSLALALSTSIIKIFPS